MPDQETDRETRSRPWSGTVDSGLVAILLAVLCYGGAYYLTVLQVRVSVVASSGGLSGTILLVPKAHYHTFGVVPDGVMQTVFWPVHEVDRRVFPARWEVASMPLPVQRVRAAGHTPATAGGIQTR